MSEEQAKWDGSSHLTQISGKDYLEVKWRLVGLRKDYPDAKIETILIRDDGAAALFKAIVLLPNGGMGQGHGSESINDFGDYVEKAETKALGRALASCGYGTQFCTDFDEGKRGDEVRVADSPVSIRRPRPQQVAQATSKDQGFRTQKTGVDDKATPDQLKVVRAILLDTGEFGGRGSPDWALLNSYAGDLRELTYGEAQLAIENLRHFQGEKKGNPLRLLGDWDEYLGRFAVPANVGGDTVVDADPWDGDDGPPELPL